MTQTQTYGFQQRLEPFDTGWTTFEHHYLLYASQGAFMLEAANALWLLPPHRAALIEARTPVRIQARHEVGCCSIIFDRTAFAAPVQPCRVFAMSTLAREMVAYAMRWPQERTPDSAAAPFFYALAAVAQELAQHADFFWLPQARSAELQQALLLTRQQFDQPLTQSSIASAAALSERTLARRCSSELGMNWSQYLQRVRMIEAATALSTTAVSITEIASACGFEHSSAFTRAFRTLTGQTPSQFRGAQSPGDPAAD